MVFQPPEPPPPIQHEWATWIPDRWPRFKTHSKKSFAYNAVNLYSGWGPPRGGIVYILYAAQGAKPQWVEHERVYGRAFKKEEEH